MDELDATKYIEDFEYDGELEKRVEEGRCILCGSEMKYIDLGKTGWMEICVNPKCPYRVETKVFME